MNIAVVSFEDKDVSKGIELLLDKYSDAAPTVHLPILGVDKKFSQSVIRTCIEKGVNVTAYFSSAEGIDHILKQANDFVVVDTPIAEMLTHLSVGDSLAMTWDDSPELHYVVHSVDDLALDLWDITDGLTEVDDIDDFEEIDNDKLHEAMMSSLGHFVDLLAAFVANTVMDSLSKAVAEHIQESENLTEINPFDEE